MMKNGVSKTDKLIKISPEFETFHGITLADLNVKKALPLYCEAFYFSAKYRPESSRGRAVIVSWFYNKRVAPQIEIINDFASEAGEHAIAAALVTETVIRPTLYDALRDGFEEPQHELYKLKHLSKATGYILALTYQQQALGRFKGFEETDPEFERLDPIDADTAIYVLSKNIIQMKLERVQDTKIGVVKPTPEQKNKKMSNWIHLYNAVKYKQLKTEPKLEALYRNELRSLIRLWHLDDAEYRGFLKSIGEKVEAVEKNAAKISKDFNPSVSSKQNSFIDKHGSKKRLRLKNRLKK